MPGGRRRRALRDYQRALWPQAATRRHSNRHTRRAPICRLRRNDFGAPKPPTTSSPRISQGSTRASASGSTAPTNASAPAPGSSTRGLQTSPAAAAPAAEGAASSGRSVDDASQERVEKGECPAS